MNAENDIIMNILYSPAVYTNKSNYPVDYIFNENSDFFLNYWLLTHYELHDLPDTWQPYDYLLSLILINWDKIPLVADLIGGYLLRDKLSLDREKFMTNPCLLAFISLPLLHNARLTCYETTIDTTSYGAAFILNIFSDIPAALIQRFFLCFPVGMELPQIHATKTPGNINLLQMAVNYAHNY